MRLLIASIHCYLDPSSGTALGTREMLELLAERGMDCRVLPTRILDPERETSLDEVLATLELPVQRFQAQLGMDRAAEVIDLGVNGVRGLETGTQLVLDSSCVLVPARVPVPARRLAPYPSPHPTSHFSPRST